MQRVGRVLMMVVMVIIRRHLTTSFSPIRARQRRGRGRRGGRHPIVGEREKPAFGDALVRIIAKAQKVGPMQCIMSHHDLKGVRGQAVRVLGAAVGGSDGWVGVEHEENRGNEGCGQISGFKTDENQMCNPIQIRNKMQRNRNTRVNIVELSIIPDRRCTQCRRATDTRSAANGWILAAVAAAATVTVLRLRQVQLAVDPFHSVQTLPRPSRR